MEAEKEYEYVAMTLKDFSEIYEWVVSKPYKEVAAIAPIFSRARVAKAPEVQTVQAEVVE